MTTPSWYDVLDVEQTASADEVRAAWRSAIADLEPGSRRFASLNQAAEVLLDEQKRAAYDAELAAQAPEPEPVTGPEVVVASETGPSPTARAGAARAVPTWLLAVLGVLAALCVAGAIWAWQTGDEAGKEESARSAQSAAERAIVPLLSYDYESLEEDRQRAKSFVTADYFKDYDQLFGVITDNAPTTQTKVSAQVIASGIVRSGEDRVDVLVFVDRPTTNKLTPEPVVYKDQVTVTMQKVGEDWLIDNLVTSPAAQ